VYEDEEWQFKIEKADVSTGIIALRFKIFSASFASIRI
jgi:hypothetical protein